MDAPPHVVVRHADARVLCLHCGVIDLTDHTVRRPASEAVRLLDAFGDAHRDCRPTSEQQRL